MTFGELWAVALGTVVALGLLLGLFLFKKALKKSLFPGEPETPREQAMADLLLFQAELEKRSVASESPGKAQGTEAGGDPEGGLDGGPPPHSHGPLSPRS